MKKFITTIICFIIILILIITYFLFTKKDDTDSTNLTKIKLAEVTHSAFYTPLYVANELGYFKDAGIDLELILTPGADKVSAAVLSNTVDIGFAGTESAAYIYDGGEKDYLVTFAGLTKRDGQFLISRNCNQKFSLTDLYNHEILVGRKGGMPALSFLNAMKNNNIDLSQININYSIDFAALSGTFIGGLGDYVNLFEPTATTVVNISNACIVESIGKLSGEVPYTAFYTRKSYLTKNKDLLTAFTNALAKGINYTLNHESKDVAQVILPAFPDSSLNDLTTIIDNYKKYDSWLSSPYISEESFNNLKNLLQDNDLLTNDISYNDLIYNLYE